MQWQTYNIGDIRFNGSSPQENGKNISTHSHLLPNDDRLLRDRALLLGDRLMHDLKGALTCRRYERRNHLQLRASSSSHFFPRNSNLPPKK